MLGFSRRWRPLVDRRAGAERRPDVSTAGRSGPWRAVDTPGAPGHPMRRMQLAKPARYIPALRIDWLTPLYDPVLRWVMREERFKRTLVAQAGLRLGHRALDLGFRTGTLTIMLKPGDEFHLADFGKPGSTYGRLVAVLMRRFEEVADNLDGRLPQMMRSAGFQEVVRTARLDSVFGTLEVLRGVKGAQTDSERGLVAVVRPLVGGIKPTALPNGRPTDARPPPFTR